MTGAEVFCQVLFLGFEAENILTLASKIGNLHNPKLSYQFFDAPRV